MRTRGIEICRRSTRPILTTATPSTSDHTTPPNRKKKTDPRPQARRPQVPARRRPLPRRGCRGREARGRGAGGRDARGAGQCEGGAGGARRGAGRALGGVLRAALCGGGADEGARRAGGRRRRRKGKRQRRRRGLGPEAAATRGANDNDGGLPSAPKGDTSAGSGMRGWRGTSPVWKRRSSLRR